MVSRRSSRPTRSKMRCTSRGPRTTAKAPPASEASSTSRRPAESMNVTSRRSSTIARGLLARRRRAPAPARRRWRGRSRRRARRRRLAGGRRVTENSGAGSTGAIFSCATDPDTNEGCLSTSITPSSPRATSSPRRATSRTCSVWRSRRRPAHSPSCASTTASCCSSRPRRPATIVPIHLCLQVDDARFDALVARLAGARAGPLGGPAPQPARHQSQPRRPWRVLPGPLRQLLRGDNAALR